MPRNAAGTGPFTYDDLQQMPDDGRRYELIEGDLHMSPAPTFWHQRVVTKLVAFLLRAERAGHGIVVPGPTDVIFGAENVVEPDVLFIAAERMAVAVREGVRGAPDLVVEVLSDSSRRRDVRLKLRLYERFGVRYYWIVDPDEEAVRVYGRGEVGYAAPVTLVAGQPLRCEMFPGIEVDVADLFRQP